MAWPSRWPLHLLMLTSLTAEVNILNVMEIVGPFLAHHVGRVVVNECKYY